MNFEWEQLGWPIYITLLFLLPACFLLWVRGKRYALRPDSHLPGALLRAGGLAICASWTLVLFGGGHGGAAFPLPAILTVLLLGQGGYLGSWPSLWLTPGLPFITYIVATFVTWYRLFRQKHS